MSQQQPKNELSAAKKKKEDQNEGIGVGAIIGIVAGCLILVLFIIIGVLLFVRFIKAKNFQASGLSTGNVDWEKGCAKVVEIMDNEFIDESNQRVFSSSILGSRCYPGCEEKISDYAKEKIKNLKCNDQWMLNLNPAIQSQCDDLNRIHEHCLNPASRN